MSRDDTSRSAEECEAEVEELREENELLRASSQAFGDLAERLKHSLEIERRRAHQDGGAPRGLRRAPNSVEPESREED